MSAAIAEQFLDVSSLSLLGYGVRRHDDALIFATRRESPGWAAVMQPFVWRWLVITGWVRPARRREYPV